MELNGGAGTLSAADLGTSTDNCTASGDIQVAFYTALVPGGNEIGGTVFYDCDDQGAQTVAVLVSDASGNLTQCEVDINVTDGDGSCVIPFVENDNQGEATPLINLSEEDDNSNLTENVNEVSIISSNAYPNPFAYRTKVEYVLAAPTNINISVLDMSGRKVEELVNGVRSSGKHATTWSSTAQDAGTYYIVLQTETGERQVIKVLKVK